MKLEDNNRKKIGKFTNMDIKQYTLEYPWVKEEIEREIKKHLETNKEET